MGFSGERCGCVHPVFPIASCPALRCGRNTHGSISPTLSAGQGEPFVWFSHPGASGVAFKVLPLVASIFGHPMPYDDSAADQELRMIAP